MRQAIKFVNDDIIAYAYRTVVDGPR